jgi:hypothetical protein
MITVSNRMLIAKTNDVRVSNMDATLRAETRTASVVVLHAGHPVAILLRLLKRALDGDDDYASWRRRSTCARFSREISRSNSTFILVVDSCLEGPLHVLIVLTFVVLPSVHTGVLCISALGTSS